MHSDAETLYKNHLELEVKEWIPNESYSDLAEANGAIEFFSNCVNNEQLPYVLAIELKRTGELIGDVGINEVSGNIGQVEIGYTISKRYSGMGYATEVVKAMTDFTQEKFGFNVFFGRIMKGNSASIKVLEKNEFEFLKEEFGAEDDPFGKGMLVYRKEL